MDATGGSRYGRGMELWELVAREQIRDTIARYNHAGDSGRFDEMVEQFHPDGVLELVDSGERHAGRDALRGFFTGVAARFAASLEPRAPRGPLRHCVTNIRIIVDNPRAAHSDAYFLVITAIGLDHWGRYRDRFTPHEGRWLLEHRSVRTDGYADASTFSPGRLEPPPG